MNHPIILLGSKPQGGGRVARCTGLRGPESAEPGTLLQEAVGDSDGDEHDDEEGNIYVTFAVRQALC